MKRCLVLALAFVALSSSAYAQQWRYRPSELAPATLGPSVHLLRSGTGFLEVGEGWMARRSGEGGVEFAGWLQPPQDGTAVERLLALEEGGWLSLRGKALSTSTSVCELHRFDPMGRQLWTTRSDVDAAGCEQLRLFRDRQDGGWLLQQPASTEERRVLRLGEDGQLTPLDLSRLPPGSVRVLRQRRDTSFDLIVVAAGRLLRSQLVAGSAQPATELIALPTNSALAMTARHVVASDGSLWWLSAGMGGDRRTSLLRFDPEGRLLWGRILDLPEGHDVIGMSLMSDVVLGVLSARRLDRGEPALRFFGINGDLQATRPLGDATAIAVVPQVAIDPVLEPAIITVELSQEFIQRRSSFNVLGNTLSTPIEHGGRAFASSWPQVALDTQVSRPLAAFDLSSGYGDLVLGEQGATLQSVDLEGRPTQLRELFTGASQPRSQPIAVAGTTERVCAGPLSSQGLVGTQHALLACLSRASGAPLYEVRDTLPGVGSLHGLRALPTLRLDAQQRALTLTVSEQGAVRELSLLRIAADGARGERFPIGPLVAGIDAVEWRSALDAEGQALFAMAHPLGGLQVSGRSAAGVVWQRRLVAAESVLPVEVLDLGSGGAVLIVTVGQDQASRSEVWALTAAGELRDRIPLGNGAHQGEPVGLLRRAGDAVLVAFEQAIAGSTRRDRRVGLLDPLRGQWIWQREELRIDADRLADAGVDVARQRVLLLAERASQPLLSMFALGNGEPDVVQSLRCADRAACRARALRIDEDGSARVLSEVEFNDGARVPELLRVRIADVTTALPVEGLEGVWYTPETSGQGLVLNVVPNERALLGGWFTFSEAGGNAAAEQRWYSLDARYLPGAQRLDLNLRRASAAAFDTEGRALIEDLGDGQLWLLACDQAVLRYRFESGEEAGLTGEIPLQRLGPADGVCAQTAAGGAISPYSGSWYQPTQSGQGLLMEVLPATASRPALLSAGWFTFDPPGRSDDTYQQRWFFIQGPAPSTEGETREVAIFAALGAKLEASATLNVREVGRARVRFVGCGEARLEYRFDVGAGDFAGREGTIELVRLAGCGSGAR